MSFAVLPYQISRTEAQAAFDDALNYLGDSPMADSIIGELRNLRAIISIYVGPGLEDKYIHPKDDSDAANGGTVEWDPDFSLSVVDKAKYRPQVRWVKNKTVRHGFLGHKETAVNASGTISAAVCLMHELGHAHQFFSDRTGYRQTVKDIAKPQEDHVVAGIENTVVLELRKRGHKEGVRWGYLDTA